MYAITDDSVGSDNHAVVLKLFVVVIVEDAVSVVIPVMVSIAGGDRHVDSPLEAGRLHADVDLDAVGKPRHCREFRTWSVVSKEQSSRNDVTFQYSGVDQFFANFLEILTTF